MSKIIGLKELRENTENYISKIEKGYSFVVVRKSKPVFRLSPVDVWDDEGEWESILDFREINKNGVEIGKVIKALKELNEQDKKILK